MKSHFNEANTVAQMFKGVSADKAHPGPLTSHE